MNRPITKRLSQIFLKGLIALLPVSLTFYLLAWTARTAENAFGEPLRTWLPQAFYFPGAGVILMAALILAVGALIESYVTIRFFDWLEASVEKMPIIGSIYTPLRDLTQLIARQSDSPSQRVVFVRLEPLGVEALGMVMRDQFADLPKDMTNGDQVAVFIPFSYGVGGFTVLVSKAKIRETSLATDRALQLAITGWIKSTK
jgi:uncharacterized membrane protein